MAVVLELAYFVLLVFFILLLARLVFDYVMMFARSWRPSGVAAVGLEVVYSATDPPLKALRRVIPPLRLGNFSIDLGFMVLLFIVYLLMNFVGAAANQ
ncbi:MAG: Cell division integral membrane protein, YggT and half-length relatives [uncultured Corynebacteriales bacterium]|uniref:Cell division integral membrane protein, YggT and half-length relatives n=1 Tax=uncultured Mycobacteriales bacterium TaxID=581187 RepID=A0A6J4J560_9ACTN|nr:MAG: Cell division integral membrane protein, YggT and half-length relatives [uncultured Corynebacteriales bacterium]